MLMLKDYPAMASCTPLMILLNHAQNEENSGAMTNNDVVMEASPAYQLLEIGPKKG